MRRFSILVVLVAALASVRCRAVTARLLIANVVLGPGLFALAACSSVDPAPPDFLLGVSRDDTGALHVWLGNCDGHAARRIAVSPIDSTKAPLWDVVGSSGSGMSLDRSVPVDVVVGEAPTGMTTRAWSPQAAARASELFVTANFRDQADTSVGVDADLTGVPEGTIVAHGRRYTVDQFKREMPQTLCGTRQSG